jgi:hypothetical protein
METYGLHRCELFKNNCLRDLKQSTSSMLDASRPLLAKSPLPAQFYSCFSTRFLQLSRTSSTPLRTIITFQKQNLKGFNHHKAPLPRALRASLTTVAPLAFGPWVSLRIFPSSIHSMTTIGSSGHHHRSPLWRL